MLLKISPTLRYTLNSCLVLINRLCLNSKNIILKFFINFKYSLLSILAISDSITVFM